MTTIDSLDLAEEFAPEDDVLADARRRAKEVGVVPVRPGAGATLQFLAAIIQARTIAEIGTGTGLSGLRLLRGMGSEGVLTSIDLEAEHQRHAKEIFLAAGIAPRRFRLIPGAGLDVMTRLTDGAYDLVFLDGDKTEYGEYLDEALRLVRPGGVIVFDNALWHDRVADRSHRDPETTAIRELIERVKDDHALEALLVPLGDGVLAVRAPV